MDRAGSIHNQITGFCEHSNGTSGTVKAGNFFASEISITCSREEDPAPQRLISYNVKKLCIIICKCPSITLLETS
jgi:hypothetical protein